MITVEITKHKNQFQTNQTWPHFAHSTVPYNERFKMGKIEYAQYLATIPLKPGDIVVSKFVIDSPKIMVWQCEELVDIIEIHHQVNTWMSIDNGGPLCLVFRGRDGALQKYKGGGSMWLKCPEEKIPEEWKAIRARRHNMANDDGVDYSC